ncbi:MAG: hypothetical protein KatS3mg110_0078 [Pirellulaceae bacterium]|nr:MAG: hypothetical protein KatS3mg110_0078 [Pirellulaceae bacterium]
MVNYRPEDASRPAWRDSPPKHAPSTQNAADSELDRLLERIERLAGKSLRQPQVAGAPSATRTPARAAPDEKLFVPRVKGSLREMGLTESDVESLVLKYLLARGDAYGREIAQQIKLPFCLLEELLRQMKTDQLVVYRGANEWNDYLYQLTDLGRERARRLAQVCTYFGAAPVSLADYIASVEAQSLRHQSVCPADLERAFQDLIISPAMLQRLGPAVVAGRGLFLFGPPGNGKTSIAKRISHVFGKTIWVPRAIQIDGEIVRVFDPHKHREVPVEWSEGLLDKQSIDRRWVCIERPTIVVGGELTMAHLEITENPVTHICEAPLQMKSNCGVLVIDDFGRQRIRIDELLNRWIVPLEEKIDFLSLPSGKTIQVPFDQLIIFSTNLEPRELVDEAFLRRIAYKIEIRDPSEAEFRELFRMVAGQLGMEYRDEVVSYVIEKHYRKEGRSFRCCHARDLLYQVKAYCQYSRRPLEMTPQYMDLAAENYFSVV